MLETIYHFALFIFVCVTFYLISVRATAVGTTLGITTFYLHVLPGLVNDQSLSHSEGEAIIDTLVAENNGEIAPEEAAKILRNIRGEK